MRTMQPELKAFVSGTAGVTATLLAILFAIYGAGTADVLAQLASMSSLLLTGVNGYASLGGGFSANILISLIAMAISILVGAALGACLIAQNPFLRNVFRFIMNFFRNSPWLVILYAMLYLIPYEMTVFGYTISLSPAVKAIIGLSLPITANVAEVFRSGVESIPSGQWEASLALGYNRRQTLYQVILPQALPLMLPNMMTVYASLFIGTSLIVVTGTNDILSIARVIIASGNEHYATAIYIFILFAFFIYAFPIAMTTRWVERRLRSVSR